MSVVIVLFFLFLRCISTAVDSGFHVTDDQYKCLEKERQALLLFKADIIADDDGLLSSWSSKDDNKNCCKWRGVQCSNQTGHVIKLHLHARFDYDGHRQEIRGKISPSLLQLPHLTYLDLSRNDFSDQPFPKFIGSLTKLNYLDLSFTKIVGTIPSQLGNLSHLQYLDLGFNSLLDSNLEWLPHLSSLEHLNLDEVDLSKAIHWVDIINSLPLLSHVGLYYCQLSSVVYPYHSLINSSTSITTLDLGSNNFTSSMYHWLFNLSTSLVNLTLFNNQLEGPIPEGFGKMTSLALLDLQDNQLQGPIPEDFGKMTSLALLDLSSNQLEGPIPEGFGKMTSLALLDLSSNQLEGPIPEDFGKMTSLAHLDLSFNQLQGPILEGFGKMTSLAHLYLSSNQLQGPILEGFGKMTSLAHLDLSSNQLQGPIPEDFGKMTSLALLDLTSNQLQGPIPEDFGKMTSLAHLRLSRNYELGIAGIPKSFGNLCSLQYLYLYNSSISGNLADFLHNLSGCADATLEELHVGENKLTGSLPDSVVRFSSLKFLDLSRNQLNGTVSENLGTLSRLARLDLSFNSLQGVLQEAHFLNLPSLFHLDLSFNSLRLEVSSQWIPQFQLMHIDLNSCKIGPRFPEWIQTQKNLYYLDIANCGISDNIPTSFWDQLTGLAYINISTNQIRGKVPDFPSNFGSYNYPRIDLSSNLFEGQIPLFPSRSTLLNLSNNKFVGSLSLLCQIMDKELIILDLSQNSLTDALPDCLMQFQKLVVLNLAHNRLFGEISTSIGSLFQLETLNLYNNSFSGELPLSLKNCTALRFLDLGANNFSGNVPSVLVANLQWLYALSLRSNNFSGIIPLQLCYLTNLQILDLSLNNFFGRIPSCLNDLTAMVRVVGSLDVSIHYIYEVSNSTIPEWWSQSLDYAVLQWQGKERELKNLGLLKMIDLSSNQLTGEIPNAITSLLGLVVLDLSSNKLHGKIPKEIGQLRLVLTLNLSRNELSGNIPASMSNLSLLNNLDLSGNNLSGRIPTGTQLQSFNASSYVGNSGLCGPPLPLKCSSLIIVDNGDYEEDKDEFWKWFYIGTMIGFITGFWGICGALLLNCTCRHVFFRFINNSKDWLYVRITMHINKMQR